MLLELMMMMGPTRPSPSPSVASGSHLGGLNDSHPHSVRPSHSSSLSRTLSLSAAGASAARSGRTAGLLEAAQEEEWERLRINTEPPSNQPPLPSSRPLWTGFGTGGGGGGFEEIQLQDSLSPLNQSRRPPPTIFQYHHHSPPHFPSDHLRGKNRKGDRICKPIVSPPPTVPPPLMQKVVKLGRHHLFDCPGSVA